MADSLPYKAAPSSGSTSSDSQQIELVHVAFMTDAITFDCILAQLQSQGIAFGSQPNDVTNSRVDHPLAERGLYFRMPDGHLFEVMTSSSGADGR